MLVSGCLPLHGHTIRFTVWASGKQNSVLEDVVLESRLPFVQISFIYRKTASKTLSGIKGGFEEKKQDREKQKNPFRHSGRSVAPAKFPLKRPEKLSGILFTGSFQL